MGKTRAWLLCLWLALKWVPRQNLGDLVWCRGEQWVICNGVTCGRWTLRKPGAYGPGLDVPRSECRKVKTVRNYLRSFRSGWRFYKTSWFQIWARVGIKDWMRGCRIWANH